MAKKKASKSAAVEEKQYPDTPWGHRQREKAGGFPIEVQELASPEDAEEPEADAE